MIRDLSATLQAILSDPVMTGPFPELSHALIAFDRPDDTFRPTQTMLDLFLFDVRENMELRSNEPRMGRQNGQVLINQAPMRVACTYLITAWPVGGTELALQEQRLLTQANPEATFSNLAGIGVDLEHAKTQDRHRLSLRGPGGHHSTPAWT